MKSLRPRSVLLAAVFSLAVFAFSRYAGGAERIREDRAREAWMLGYLKLEEAAKAVDQGKQLFALSLFEEALDVFENVQEDFPTWNPGIVTFRINYCKERINSLQFAAEVDAEKMSRPDLIAEVRRLRKQLSGDEGARLKEEVSSLREALDKANADKAQLEAQIKTGADVAAVKTQLEARIEELVGERDALKQESEKGAGFKAQFEEQKLVNEGLAEKNSQIQSEIADLREAAAKAAEAKLETESTLDKLKADYRAALDELQRQQQTAVTEKDSLSQALENQKKLAESASEDRDKLSETVRDLETKYSSVLEEKNAQITSLSEQLTAAKAALETQHQESVAALDELRRQQQTTVAEKDSTSEALENQKQLTESASKDRDKLSETVRDLEAKYSSTVAEKNGQIAALTDQLTAAKTALGEFQRQQQTTVAEKDSVSQALENQKQLTERVSSERDKLSETVRDLETKYSSTVAEKNGQIAVLTDQLTAAKAALETQRQESVVALDTLQKQHLAVLAEQKSQADKVRSEAENAHAAQVVQMKDIMDSEKAELTAGIAALEKQLKEKNEALAKAQKRVTEVPELELKWRSRIKEAETDRDTIKAQFTKVKESIETATGEKVRSLPFTGGVEKQAEKLSDQLASLAANYAETKSQLDAALVCVSTGEAERAALENKLTSTEGFLKESVTKQGALEQQLATVQEAESQKTSLLASLRQTVTEKEATIKAAASDLSARDSRIESLSRELQQSGTETSRLQLELKDAQAKIAELKRLTEVAQAVDIDSLQADLRQKNSELVSVQNHVKELQKDLLSRTEAEKRLIEERNKRLDEEKQVREKQRETEVKLHDLLAAAAAAEKSKDSEAAVWNLKQVIEMDPGNRDAYAHVGVLLAERGQDPEAEGYLKKAFELNPTDPDIALRLGYVYLRQEKVQPAAAVLMLGSQLAPEKAELQHFLGIACRSLGWTAAAEQALKKAFELDSTNADTAFNLAVLLATLDEPRLDEAREWYKKAVALGAKPNSSMERVFAQ